MRLVRVFLKACGVLSAAVASAVLLMAVFLFVRLMAFALVIPFLLACR